MKNLRNVNTTAFLSFISSTILGLVCEYFYGLFDNDFLSPGFRVLLFSGIWFVIGIVGVIVIKFFSTARIDYTQTKKSIVEVSKNFRLADGSTLFAFDEDNNKIVAAEGKKKHSNILYYSLSAKAYLNWIDYIYFLYLRSLRDKLQCTLIIGLHFPDHIKECKNIKDGIESPNPDADPNGLAVEYDDICRTFEENARKILGKKVIFYRETDFYKSNPKKYAESFRNIYNSFVLYFAKNASTDGETMNYKNFKRRISHMESSFPVWMLAEKFHTSRLFVLDNKVALEIWDYQPLNDIRKRNDIFFILTNSIVDKNGNRINVHNKNNVINLTDTAEELQNKLQNLSDEDKELLISLFLQDDEVFKHTGTFYNKLDPTQKLSEMLDMICSNYNFIR